jgi:hypothetical protein
MSDEMTIRIDSDEYVARRDGADLRLGRRVGSEITWLDAVELELLPAAAQEAFDRGDASDEALLNALRGIVSAEVQRGG